MEELGLEVLKASSIYRTQPVDYPRQPWFYNQVLEVEAPVDPLSLLSLVKAVEQRMRRMPAADKGPRKIDIDILLAGRTVVQTRRLKIPHPRMTQRNFVLIPFNEIAPYAVHPLLHQRVSEILRRSGDPSQVSKVLSFRLFRKVRKPCRKKSN
jgi:2-amino-4-hydroxy-6-hydroxymethyldihydropteridine diphosphokinase